MNDIQNLIRLKRKGISSAAAAVILATISVTLVGTTYLFTAGVMKGATAETFEVIDIFGNRTIVRNTGTEAIEEFSCLVDGKKIDCEIEDESIPPNKVGTVVLDLEGIEEGSHELTLMTKSMSQRWRWVFKRITVTATTTPTTTPTTLPIISSTTTFTPSCISNEDCCIYAYEGLWKCHDGVCDPCVPGAEGCIDCSAIIASIVEKTEVRPLVGVLAVSYDFSESCGLKSGSSCSCTDKEQFECTQVNCYDTTGCAKECPDPPPHSHYVSDTCSISGNGCCKEYMACIL